MSRLVEGAKRVALRAIYGTPPSADGEYGTRVMSPADGAARAREVLEAGAPAMVARFGSTEMACCTFCVRWRRGRLLPLPYLRQIRTAAWTNSGIFPTDDAALDRFCEFYLSRLRLVDVLGVWFNPGEDRIVRQFCPQARLVQLEALNPLLHEVPWSATLAGKRVLVIHPFASTIERQYRERRESLFANPNVLPKFELLTLKAVQTIGGDSAGFASWFDALASMLEQVRAMEFDVAVIGAGAYGLPLAAAIKEMGRQAVQLGGQTQLLFGIRGRRWETESPDDIAPLMNEYWVRPSTEETPTNADAVEGGCYW